MFKYIFNYQPYNFYVDSSVEDLQRGVDKIVAIIGGITQKSISSIKISYNRNPLCLFLFFYKNTQNYFKSLMSNLNLCYGIIRYIAECHKSI